MKSCFSYMCPGITGRIGNQPASHLRVTYFVGASERMDKFFTASLIIYIITQT